MPTVLGVGPYRLHFFGHEPNQPPHIYVDRHDLSSKFWLDPVALTRNWGYNAKEFGEVERVMVAHQTELLEASDEYFGT